MKVIDSGMQPNAQQIAAAKADGVEAWLGYRSSTTHENLAHPWVPATFARIKAGGLLTGAYYSGLDDPAWCKADAASLGIKGFLDCENGIRGDGVWTDPWLDASGFHLYGGSTVQTNHRTHGHEGYVFAAYPGGVQTATWPSYQAAPSPARPVGWQYLGTQSKPYGVVDLCNFDPALLGTAPVPPLEGDMLQVFDATVVAGQYQGVVASFVSNGMRFRWIQSGSQLADILSVGAVFNGGQPVEHHTPGVPVADVGAFGNPDDPVTAAMLGLPFGTPASAPVSLNIALAGTATPG